MSYLTPNTRSRCASVKRLLSQEPPNNRIERSRER